jgi:hypothetical protein
LNHIFAAILSLIQSGRPFWRWTGEREVGVRKNKASRG